MKKPFGGVLLASAVLMLAGCYQTQEGTYKAGVPGARDTIESKYERSLDEVFDAARKALAYNGTILVDNSVNHTLKAKVDTRNVWVRVEQAEPTITRIYTQARRKSGAGDIHLAAELDKQTALHLRVLPSSQIRPDSSR